MFVERVSSVTRIQSAGMQVRTLPAGVHVTALTYPVYRDPKALD